MQPDGSLVPSDGRVNDRKDIFFYQVPVYIALQMVPLVDLLIRLMITIMFRAQS